MKYLPCVHNQFSTYKHFGLRFDKHKTENECLGTHRGAIDVGEGEQNLL